MNETLQSDALPVSREKRILNEFEAKMLNEEKMEKVVESRKSGTESGNASIAFRCECDDKACADAISISPEEYKSVHRETKNFIVSHRHVHFDLEEVIASFPNYILVAKFLPKAARSNK
jgi:hypothetical protein